MDAHTIERRLDVITNYEAACKRMSMHPDFVRLCDMAEEKTNELRLKSFTNKDRLTNVGINDAFFIRMAPLRDRIQAIVDKRIRAEE